MLPLVAPNLLPVNQKFNLKNNNKALPMFVTKERIQLFKELQPVPMMIGLMRKA